ncbi:hypothetical protein J4447_00285 [Candidatus Pacearchaeota archaeon]|nr:hypothetical protein [Candidatus Pacearchaeota archaeon]
MAKGGDNKKHRVSEALAIVALILNIIIIPGLGTLIGRRTREGIWQLVMSLGGLIIGMFIVLVSMGAEMIALMFLGFAVMFILPIAAWIWGIISGIKLIKESEK